MKKILFSALFLLVSLTIFAVDTSYNAGIYREQGGNTMIVGTNGVLNIDGGAFKISGTQVTATAAQLNRVDATSSIQTQLNAKQATITGAATTVDTEDLTASKVLASNASGKIVASSVTDTTLGYLDATSSVQTQLNTKPTISSGTAAPTTTPAKIGDIFIDTSAHKLYFADAIADSTGWINAMP